MHLSKVSSSTADAT